MICERAIRRIAPTENHKFRLPSYQTIGTIVRGFKSAITKRINEIRDNPDCPVWQRNYYEYVIRSEEELNSIMQYLVENPLKWELDEENPANIKTSKEIDYAPCS